ncbi:uncharacterized protein T551_03418 [Pneumocystis jirovecii RU7]|uniref:IMS import disulfide relay-system CHCH-CHCH-like Cx9C domain-containing protein n=1 Tax=Pneumocystis jirovecii (strain RU7) TaxID=1408657 RepID=A0A0W4ZDT9_PNEJ7|nr:uncharacterized protein T551_03418 [Pneumocystis jirovecii RU7]KTW26501.1 hypothetical protein T551_03418 [Pneumocystis jirovecii RU7]
MKKNNQRIQDFMRTSKFCNFLGIMYGKCIIKNVNNIEKDICVSEFQKFKNCLEKIV